KPVVVAAAAAPVAKPTLASAAVVGASAQIGAYSSEALAAKGWSDTAAAFGGDMSGKGKHFEPVTKDGKTLYRAAVTGFGSKAEAQAFCAKLKAAGHACLVK
ncbi:MAG TPA: SPOR domain-containing protein, partial [Caulobacteraceae bacterium]|nr:SPOR domain-containing protein [Caulobacteraceae bacterium]